MQTLLTVDSPDSERKRALGVLFLTIFVNLLGFGIVIPLLPFYGSNLGASDAVVGWLFASYSLAQLVAAPFLGSLSDRYGRRPILLGSLIGTVISFLMLGAARSIPMLFASRILDGLSGGNIPTARAYISDVTPPPKRAQTYALIGIAFGGGFVFGPALGGLLVRISLDAPAYGAALLALLATVLGWRYLPETVHVTKAKRAPILSSIPAVLGDPKMAYLLLLDYVIWASVSVYQTTFSIFGHERFDWNAHQVSNILAGVGFVGAMAQGGLIRRIVPRLGEKRVLAIGLFLAAVGLGVCSGLHHETMFIVVLIPAVIGSSMVTPALVSLVSQRAEADGQGRVQGVSSSLESLGRATGPVWGTAMIDHFGGGSAYGSAAAVLGIAMLMAFGLPDKIEAPAAPEAEMLAADLPGA